MGQTCDSNCTHCKCQVFRAAKSLVRTLFTYKRWNPRASTQLNNWTTLLLAFSSCFCNEETWSTTNLGQVSTLCDKIIIVNHLQTVSESLCGRIRHDKNSRRTNGLKLKTFYSGIHSPDATVCSGASLPPKCNTWRGWAGSGKCEGATSGTS